MPTIYEQEKFHAQLSWAWKKFYNLGASAGMIYKAYGNIILIFID